MAQFSYRARKRSGEVVQGVMDVADRSAALVQIEKLGLYPVAVEAPKSSLLKRDRGPKPANAALMPKSIRSFTNPKRKPGLRELATFTQQLANLLKSGMPLTVALGSMAHLESKGISADVSKQLKQDVMEGKSLSDAMAKQPIVFSDLYVNMVRAGEQSGALVEVLRRLAAHFDRFAEVQSKFSSAMVYPIIVACVGLVIIFFFMSFMLPKFMTIFSGLNVQLPPSTQFLMDMSNFFKGYWWLMILVAIGLGLIFVRYKSTKLGRRRIDSLKMNLPVLGKVVRLNLFGQFARTLSTLLENGVSVLTALKITEQITPNVIVKEAIANTLQAVTDGKTIAQPLAQSKIFPQLMIDLLKIGEDTGDVPGALHNVAEAYENDLSTQLRVLTNLIEPALIIVMAVGVGGLLFSILSAMFAITANISR